MIAGEEGRKNKKQKKRKTEVPNSYTLKTVLKYFMLSFLRYLFSNIGLLRKTECGKGMLMYHQEIQKLGPLNK